MRIAPILLAVFLAGNLLCLPLASIACVPNSAVPECAAADCGDSGCGNDLAASGCAHCGQIGKMLASTAPRELPIRNLVPLVFLTLEEAVPEGFHPSIDQPPRMA
jgi:hypothetical protein